MEGFRFDHETRLNAAARGLWQWMTTERQVILRSKGQVRYASVSRARQVALACGALVFAGWIGYSSASYFQLRGALNLRDEAIATGEQAYRELMGDVKRSRTRFLEITNILETNHVHLVGLLEQNRALKGDLISLERKLRDAEGARTKADTRRDQLKRRLSQLEEQVRSTEQRNTRLAGELQSTETRLATALREHSEAGAEGDQLKGRIADLESRLTDVRESQRNLVSRIAESTSGDIKRLDRMIARTGLNAAKLIARLERGGRGQGGPFVPLDRGGAASELDEALFELYGQIDRWDSLQQVVRSLPIGPPVEHYYVASGFGKRRDPMNKKWAIHRGVDLSGRMRQPVHSVAPGKVLFAGWKGRFGRMIEIQHRHGIRTRYGHLRKISVKRGQTVTYRQVIGQLGSSGRSTGPHLHYEVLVNGKQVNPMKFVNAGKNVFKG